MTSKMSDLRLPSQPQSISALWLLPKYTFRRQRHNLPRAVISLVINWMGVQPTTSLSQIWISNCLWGVYSMKQTWSKLRARIMQCTCIFNTFASYLLHHVNTLLATKLAINLKWKTVREK